MISKPHQPESRRPVLPLGQIVATSGAVMALSESGQMPHEFIQRHANGDWGDLGGEDRESNEAALLLNGRILSAYHLGNGEKLWIITEADRSATTLLLPSEY